MTIDELTRKLTPRERQVVASLCEGYCNKKIAQAFGITEGTVKVHLVNIFYKVGVTGGRMALMALAVTHKDQLSAL
jgi:DNA-binding NarL/FixJ family response regulator